MGRGAFVGVLAAAGLALGGCVTAPQQPVPLLTLPPRFEGAGPVQTPVRRWWTRYGAADINRLVARADEGNLDLAIAAARLERADAQARIVGSALLPSLSGSADLSRAQGSGTTGAVVRRASLRSSAGLGLALSFELDVWGRNRDLLRAALAQGEAAVFEREVVRLSTQGAVVNAWLQMAAARDRLAIAERNLRNAERIRSVIRERLAAGTGTALDQAQQEALVASQRANLPSLRQAVDGQRTALALLVGQPPQGFRVAGGGLAAVRVPQVSPGLPSSLLLRRPDLRRAEALLAAADADVEAARKLLLPSIGLTAQTGFQSAALSQLLRPESLIWSVAAGLTQPIFEGGRIRGQIALTEAERRELIEGYRRAVISGLVDVENALTALREGQLREAAQREAVARSREAFAFAEQRLREGTIDLQTLLNAQATLFQAEDRLVSDRLERLQASVSLFLALGGDVISP